ncbi:MAG: 50S ribosomal protein L18 [Acidobacteria bacterium]|nr:MAG: 50S ribosomal protein L18 [Acidobacteriota bacterium]
MLNIASKDRVRRRAHYRLRKRVKGAEKRPRLNVYRSLNHIYGQIVDDQSGRTLVSASTLDKEVRKTLKSGGNVEAAKVVGRILAARAKAAGFTRVAFDRGGYTYHGRVKALAEAAREGGMKF